MVSKRQLFLGGPFLAVKTISGRLAFELPSLVHLTVVSVLGFRGQRPDFGVLLLLRNLLFALTCVRKL